MTLEEMRKIADWKFIYKFEDRNGFKKELKYFDNIVPSFIFPLLPSTNIGLSQDDQVQPSFVSYKEFRVTNNRIWSLKKRIVIVFYEEC